MGGPNLEVFKFGLYLFVPVFALLHFGDPQWYHNHVRPVGVLTRSTMYGSANVSLDHSTRSSYFLTEIGQTWYLWTCPVFLQPPVV